MTLISTAPPWKPERKGSGRRDWSKAWESIINVATPKRKAIAVLKHVKMNLTLAIVCFHFPRVLARVSKGQKHYNNYIIELEVFGKGFRGKCWL